MTTENQTPSAPAGPPEDAQAPRADRDLQRAALRDLVSLSAESAAAEARIEEEFRAAVEQGDKEYDNAKWVIEERHKRHADGLRQKHADRVARAEDKYQSELNALRSADNDRRRRAETEFSHIDQDVKQKYKQAVWLADSVFDVAQNTARVEAKQRREQVVSDLEALDAMDKRAKDLLELYRVSPSAGVSPSPGAAEEGGGPDPNDPDAAFAAHRQSAEQHLRRLESLKLPRLFVGMLPYILILLACGLAAAAAQWRVGTLTPDIKGIAIAAVSTLVVLIVVGVFLRILARNQVRDAHVPLRRAIDAARAAAGQRRKRIEQVEQDKHVEAVNARKAEVQSARDKFSPILSRATQTRDAALASAKAEFDEQLARVEQERNDAVAAADDSLNRHIAEADERRARDLEAARRRHEDHTADARRRHEQRRADLERHWTQGLARIQAPISQNGDSAQSPPDWETGDWQHWTPPRQFASAVRFGELAVDLPQITDQIPRKLRLPPSFSVPASLSFPAHSSLLIHTDHEGRPEAIRILQMVMARLLTSLPAGRVHFTIIDPVGLGQNFAGFMHLADHDEALVGGRIWTESDHIEQRLANLTEHMETVIQKYLRNEFETIDDYNAQAGELAEPYRFLVIADFPVGFEGDSFRRLASIASTGARCGVYTLVVRDTRVPLPSGAHTDELEAHSLNLVRKGGRFVWRDEVFQRFPLTLDAPPSEQSLTKILDLVGRHAREAKRVEVPFETIAPDPPRFWTRSSDGDVTVPIGRLGATRLQNLRLGRGVAQHALIAGKTGSGKSTLLHALVTNLAMWYSPDQVEFYLVDFKKGVEFKTYATHQLPHARAIAVESDREFGLSVLHRLDAELARRGELFRKLGVQDLAAYREIARTSSDSSLTPNPSPLTPLPRTLLIIDEFQEFFSEDDKLAQDAGVFLDRLVRQGRAFGIHVLLGSQTIGGTSGLSRSTLGQMAVRIALQTSEADSQLILGDGNSAARLLTRPGEAIYNDQGGLVEGNSPFQVAWLPDEQREVFLQQVQDLAQKRRIHPPPPIVFEGNAPADLTKNQRLAALIDAPTYPSPAPVAPAAWLGEPVAIKDPTAILLRRQSGANAIIIGQQEELAMAMMASSIVSLAAQHATDRARFVVLDGTPADSPLASVFPRLKAAIPHEMKLIEYRAVPEAMNELAEELARRQGSPDNNPPAVFVLIYGLQRYRALRKSEESFSFSASDEEKKPAPDKQFADLLREGPPLGIHTFAWADTAASLERTLDRNSMREFDNRILFQMSAADSSNLIDSPAANKLGMNRALAYSEEQGTTEKFRPYGLPTQPYLDAIKPRLAAKAR